MPDKSNSADAYTKVSTNEILTGIRSLESILGRASVDALITDLEINNMNLANSSKLYTLAEIQSALQGVFGDETAAMLFERVKKALLEKKR